MSDIGLEWKKYPKARLLKDRRAVELFGSPKPYAATLQSRKRDRPVYRLASVTDPEGAAEFVRQYGPLTQHQANAGRVPVKQILRESQILRLSGELSEGLKKRDLRGSTLRSHFLELRDLLGIGEVKDAEVTMEDEWLEAKQLGIESELSIGHATLALNRAFSSGLRDIRLEFLPRAKGPVLRKLTAGLHSVEEYSIPWPEWAWRIRVPDLLVYCYLQLALNIGSGRGVAICPACSELYLVSRSGIQVTCGRPSCRKAAQRRGLYRSGHRDTAMQLS